MLEKLKQILKKLKSLQLDDLIQRTTMILELYKNYIIFGVSVSLLFLSPTLSIAWLFFTNIYLIYFDGFNLRDIGKMWIAENSTLKTYVTRLYSSFTHSQGN